MTKSIYTIHTHCALCKVKYREPIEAATIAIPICKECRKKESVREFSLSKINNSY